jgi:hypothetical protein
LQAAVADWLGRPDIDEAIPDFIRLAEAKLQRRFRGVTNLSGSVSSNWLLTAHPDVYLYGSLLEAAPYLPEDARIPIWESAYEQRVAQVRLPDANSNFGNYAGLQAAIADWLDRPDLTLAIPNFIKLAEAKLQRRFRDITSLSSSNTSNWLLADHPDAYLYGSLLEAAPYLNDDSRVSLWGSAFNEIIDQIRRPDDSTAIDSYNTLLANVADWLDRPDLDNAIPKFIQMAEASLARDPRLREVTCRGTFSLAADGVALPDDYKELESWYHDGPVYFGPIRITSASALSDHKRRYGTTGVPAYAAILDQRIYFAPEPDATYVTRMSYYRKVTPLAGSASGTNWLLADNPDIYLYATLAEAAPYVRDDARVAFWRAELERRLEDFHQSVSNTQFSGRMRQMISGFGA